MGVEGYRLNEDYLGALGIGDAGTSRRGVPALERVALAGEQVGVEDSPAAARYALGVGVLRAAVRVEGDDDLLALGHVGVGLRLPLGVEDRVLAKSDALAVGVGGAAAVGRGVPAVEVEAVANELVLGDGRGDVLVELLVGHVARTAVGVERYLYLLLDLVLDPLGVQGDRRGLAGRPHRRAVVEGHARAVSRHVPAGERVAVAGEGVVVELSDAADGDGLLIHRPLAAVGVEGDDGVLDRGDVLAPLRVEGRVPVEGRAVARSVRRAAAVGGGVPAGEGEARLAERVGDEVRRDAGLRLGDDDLGPVAVVVGDRDGRDGRDDLGPLGVQGDVGLDRHVAAVGDRDAGSVGRGVPARERVPVAGERVRRRRGDLALDELLATHRASAAVGVVAERHVLDLRLDVVLGPLGVEMLLDLVDCEGVVRRVGGAAAVRLGVPRDEGEPVAGEGVLHDLDWEAYVALRADGLALAAVGDVEERAPLRLLPLGVQRHGRVDVGRDRVSRLVRVAAAVGGGVPADEVVAVAAEAVLGYRVCRVLLAALAVDRAVLGPVAVVCHRGLRDGVPHGVERHVLLADDVGVAGLVDGARSVRRRVPSDEVHAVLDEAVRRNRHGVARVAVEAVDRSRAAVGVEGDVVVLRDVPLRVDVPAVDDRDAAVAVLGRGRQHGAGEVVLGHGVAGGVGLAGAVAEEVPVAEVMAVPHGSLRGDERLAGRVLELDDLVRAVVGVREDDVFDDLGVRPLRVEGDGVALHGDLLAVGVAHAAAVGDGVPA